MHVIAQSMKVLLIFKKEKKNSILSMTFLLNPLPPLFFMIIGPAATILSFLGFRSEFLKMSRNQFFELRKHTYLGQIFAINRFF
jgi:uncharacterized membrane protein